MTRLVLRSLNAPALLLLTLIGIALQTSLFATRPLSYLEPELALLVVIWCALRRGFTEGGLLTLIIAEVAESHSAAPQGFFLILFMMAYLAVRGASKLLVIPNLGSYAFLTLVVASGWKIGSEILLGLLGGSTSAWWQTLIETLRFAPVQALAGLWVFRWLERFDRLTFRTGIQGQLRLDDELGLQEL